MSFLTPLHPLESGIIETLGQYQNLSIKELHEHLHNSHKVETSQQTLYRIVAHLIDKQVLVRNKGVLSLNLIWVNHLLRFAKFTEQSYLSNLSTSQIIPIKEGEELVHKADSLAGLDVIWNHALIELAHRYSGQSFYAYNSHGWYPIGMQEKETRLFSSLLKSNINVFMLYGHDTYLDRHALSLASREGVQAHALHSSAIHTDLQREDLLVWVAGDHTITCELPTSLAKHFSIFFQVVDDITQFDIDFFSELFYLRSQPQIKITCGEKYSQTWRNRIMSSISN